MSAQALLRKLAFTTVAGLAGLVLVEATAWGLEQLKPHHDALLPVPAAHGNQAVPHEVWQRFARTDDVQIELTAGDDNPWDLPSDRVVRQGSKLCRINSLGLRGPELEPGGDRLMTTGDSSIFGFGVEEDEVLSHVAAAELSTALGRPVVAVNGGVPGYTAWMSCTKLERVIDQVDPTWLVIGNLWSDLAYGPEEEVRPKPHALQRLATFRLAVDLLGPWLSPRQISWVDPAALGQQEARAGRLAAYEKELTTMARMASERGAWPLFLALPAPVDFDTRQLPFLVRAYRAAMRDVAARFDAPYLDGAGTFAEHGADLGYFFDAVHPSPRGHALLGQLLADAIASDARYSRTQ